MNHIDFNTVGTIEKISAECLTDIESQIATAEYRVYLSKQIKEIGKKIAKEFNLDLSGSGIHYRYWDESKREKILTPSPVYFGTHKQVNKLWNKLCKAIEPKHYHLAQILLSENYQGKPLIEILLGSKIKLKGQRDIIVVPPDMAICLQDLLVRIVDKKNIKIETEIVALIENKRINKYLSEIGEKMALALNELLFKEPTNLLKLLLSSLHLSLLKYEKNKVYRVFYHSITDHKYILGAFAGRLSNEPTESTTLKNIKFFSRGLLSYITYWEGIVSYERQQQIGKLTQLKETRLHEIEQYYSDFLNDLILIDPENDIRESLKLSTAFSMKRTSHKTGKVQRRLIVRLNVKSVRAFRFLYAQGAINYMKIEKKLENFILNKKWKCDQVRLDIALDHSLVNVDTLNIRPVITGDLGVLISDGKISQTGIVYKFFNKYGEYLRD